MRSSLAGGSRTRVLVGFGAFGAFWGTWGASLPAVQTHAGVSDAQLGVALLWIGVGALASIRWAGGLSDRFDRRMVALSIVSLALAGLVPVFVHGVVALSASLLVVGACSGAVDASINAAATRSEASGRLVVSLAHGVFSAAVVIGSIGVAALDGGSAGLVMVAAVLVAAALLTAGLSAPPAAAPAGGGAVGAGGGAGDVGDGAGGVGGGAGGGAVPGRCPGSSWPLLVLGGLAAFAYLVENAWQSWGAIQLHTTLGASAAVSALAPAVFASAAATGRFAGHTLTSAMAPSALFATGAATAAAGSVLGALAPSVPLALAGIAVAGLGTSVCAPTLITLAGRVNPSAHGAATGTVITIAYLGFVLGPAAVGLVSGATTLPIALVAVAVIAAGLFLASPILSRLTARS